MGIFGGKNDASETGRLPPGQVRRQKWPVLCSRFDNHWEGTHAREAIARAGPKPEAKHVMVHARGGCTTNVPPEILLVDDALLAGTHDGRPLCPDHGGPCRPVVPMLCFWKSARWVKGFELMAGEALGFWERAGRHMHGDSWAEERPGGR